MMLLLTTAIKVDFLVIQTQRNLPEFIDQENITKVLIGHVLKVQKYI